MDTTRLLQALIVIAAAAAALWIVASNTDGWADWVVFGVIVATAIGAGMAVHHRRYTVKRRDFVKSYDPKKGPPRR